MEAELSFCRLHAAQDILEKSRCITFKEGLAAINTHLARIYSYLTAEQGSASCSFTDDPALLFLDGVALDVR